MIMGKKERKDWAFVDTQSGVSAGLVIFEKFKSHHDHQMQYRKDSQKWLNYRTSRIIQDFIVSVS